MLEVFIRNKEICVNMSGIYGIASVNTVKHFDYSNLKIWNENYGDLPAQQYSTDHVLLGIKPELLKDNSVTADSFLSKCDNEVGVSDCLLFSEVPADVSDEKYIFGAICNNGIDSLSNINGDFAGAVWNSDGNELLLYRDHLGVRPLFYYLDDDKVIFSSDLRGITSLDYVDTSLDESWVYYNVVSVEFPSATDTEYKYIKCVPPGGYIRFSFAEGSVKAQEGKYWIAGNKKIRMKDREAYAKELRRLVEDAVKIRANATNLRIGAELSGGLDSGVISLILAQMNKDCFYYSWSPSPDDLPYAKGDERLVINDICEKAGIKCNYGGLKISFLDHDQMKVRSPLSFDEKTDNMAFPFKYAFPCYLNTSQIYETAAVMQENGVKFIFTGHSGDEGISHRSNPYELYYNHEYLRYLKLMYARSHNKKHKILNTLKLTIQNQKIMRSELLHPIPYNEARSKILKQTFIKELNPSGSWFLFPYDPKTYIRNGGIRNRFDVVAFYAASVGIRYLCPFSDYRVIDFALGIPRYLFHNGYTDRFVFRQAFKDLMPKSLYVLKEKENRSYDNLPKNTEKKPEISDKELIQMRRETLDLLSRDIWEKYLDYDVLDDWVNGKFSPGDTQSIMKAVLTCWQAEYMIKRSRDIK